MISNIKFLSTLQSECKLLSCKSELRYGMWHLRAAPVGVLPVQLFGLNKLLKSLGNSWGILQHSTSKRHLNATACYIAEASYSP